MTRATRQLTLALPLVLVYFLMLLGVLPVPFVSKTTASAIIPVVSPLLLMAGRARLGSHHR